MSRPGMRAEPCRSVHSGVMSSDVAGIDTASSERDTAGFVHPATSLLSEPVRIVGVESPVCSVIFAASRAATSHATLLGLS